MKKFYLLRRFILKNSIRNFSKEKEDPIFEYQNQQFYKQEKIIYRDENDTRQEQEALQEFRINKEDFRLNFLNQGITEEQKIEIDPVFGTEIVHPKPFDTINFQDLYVTRIKEKVKTFDLMDRIPDFRNFEINDKQLSSLLEDIYNDLGFEDIHRLYTYQYIEECYKKEEVQKKMHELSKQIQNCHQTDIPNLICYLSFKLRYDEDYVEGAKIYQTLENQIQINYHVFQLDQLIKIFYGLTFNIPKSCSTNLRIKIRQNLISAKSNKFDIYQILKLFYAIRLENNNPLIFYKCYDFIIKNYFDIKKLSKEDPKLPLDIVYTYYFCHLKQRFRKKTRTKNELQGEIDKLNDLYMELIENNFKYYDKNDIIKLSKIINSLGVDNYTEIYLQMESFILENFDKFDQQEISEILDLSLTSNEKRGIFSRNFLKKLFGKLNQYKYFQNKDINVQSNILQFLLQSKIINIKQFEKIYGEQFVDELRQLDYVGAKTLGNLTQSSMFLYLQDEKNELVLKMINNLLYIFSKQDYWIQKIFASKLNLFLFFVSKIQPTWNISIAENLLYHALKKIDSYYIRNRMNLNEYKDLDQIIRNLETNLISFLPFQYSFVLDYCMEERKLVYFLLKETDLLYHIEDEEQVVNPNFDLKVKIMQLDGWTVGVIDNKEFQALKEKKLDWLKNKLEESYKQTQEKAKKIHLDQRLDILKHDFEIQKYIYDDQRSDEMKKRTKIIEKEEKETIDKYLKEQG